MRAKKSQWDPRRPKLASECHRQSQLKPEGAKERIQVRQRASQREPERSRKPERALVSELEPEEAREKERVRKSQRGRDSSQKKKFEINLSGSPRLPLAFFGSLRLPLALSANLWLTLAHSADLAHYYSIILHIQSLLGSEHRCHADILYSVGLSGLLVDWIRVRLLEYLWS